MKITAFLLLILFISATAYACPLSGGGSGHGKKSKKVDSTVTNV